MAVLVGVTIVGSGTGPYLALDIAAGVASLALVPLLRRWPVQAALLLSLLAALSPAATPPATMAALVVGPLAPVPRRARGGRHRDRRAPGPRGLAARFRAAVRLVGGPGLRRLRRARRLGHADPRANRALISSLRDRAEQAEADQARRVAEARAAERARIAREMHDVLAHRLSLLATYAGALAYRPDAPPDQVSRAAEVVRSGVHQALDELREVIGVLRDDSLPDLAAEHRPAAGPRRPARAGRESRAAGMRVEAGGSAWPTPALPEGVLPRGCRTRPDGPCTGWCRRGSPTPASTRRASRSPSRSTAAGRGP